MKKEISVRIFFGFMLGFFIGKTVNYIISLFVGNGKYLPVMPVLESKFKTQLGAMLFQDILVGAIGTVFALAGLIFFIDKWSSVRQYTVHFFATAVFYIPFVYICWMPGNIIGALSMAGNVLFTYALTWGIQYFRNKKTLDIINEKIRNGEKTDE